MPPIEHDTALAEDGCTAESETTTVSGDCAAEELPPESFRLSKDAEYDWFERYSYCSYEREDSTKGNNNNLLPNSNSNSQRFSVNLKTKAPIIGLSQKIQMATFVDPKWRSTSNKPASGRMFPRQFGRSTAHVAEPGSPFVSCMGRVRSKSCRRRRSNSVRRSGEKPVVEEGKKKTGFCRRVLDIFRSKKTRCKKIPRSGSSRKGAVEALTEENNAGPVIWRSVSVKKRGCEPEPPGLGGMKRFASGRRPCSSLTGEDVN